MRYVLASGSPRRKELLSKVIPEYEVIPAQGEEIINSDDPAQTPLYHIIVKCLENPRTATTLRI